MIIDAHTHICPPRVRSDRPRYAVDGEVAFSAIYKDPKAKLAGASELLAMMDEQGVDRAVTFGFPWASEETARMHNDYVAEAVARAPDRVIGLACFDPLRPWAPREAERALENGLAGVGELAVYEAGFDPDAVRCFGELADVCRRRGAVMMVHVNEPIGHKYPGKAPLTLPEIYSLIQAAAGVRLVLAHWGGGVFFYHLLRKEAAEAMKDVYVDTAASPFLYRPEVYDLACRIIGPEKVLFGSDWPLLKPARYFKEMESAGLSPDWAEAIKGGSAARLFGVE